MVRIAQGILHMGKGTMTLAPYHSHRLLLDPVAAAGLLTAVIACTDVKAIMGKGHYLLHALTIAMHPRMLIALDEDLQPVSTTVRVGQAVDVVGQAGKPKTITGFQTHTTPVLLAHGERAELASEECTCAVPAGRASGRGTRVLTVRAPPAMPTRRHPGDEHAGVAGDSQEESRLRQDGRQCGRRPSDCGTVSGEGPHAVRSASRGRRPAPAAAVVAWWPAGRVVAA